MRSIRGRGKVQLDHRASLSGRTISYSSIFVMGVRITSRGIAGGAKECDQVSWSTFSRLYHCYSCTTVMLRWFDSPRLAPSLLLRPNNR